MICLVMLGSGVGLLAATVAITVVAVVTATMTAARLVTATAPTTLATSTITPVSVLSVQQNKIFIGKKSPLSAIYQHEITQNFAL